MTLANWALKENFGGYQKTLAGSKAISISFDSGEKTSNEKPLS